MGTRYKGQDVAGVFINRGDEADVCLRMFVGVLMDTLSSGRGEIGVMEDDDLE